MATLNSGSLTNQTAPYQNPGMKPKPINGPSYGPQFGQPRNGTDTLSPLGWGMPPQISGGVGGTTGTPNGPNAGTDRLSPYPPSGGNSGSATGNGPIPNPGMPPKPVGDPNYGQQGTGTPSPWGALPSSGSRSDGWNPGVMSTAGIPAVNTQTTSTNPAAPGNPYTQFTSQNNLIGSQIMPTTDPRLSTAEGYTSSAAGQLAGWNPAPFKSVSPYDASGALGQLGTANSQMQGMSTAGYRPVAGTDTSGAQGYLNLAAQAGMPSAANAGAGQMGGFSYAGDTTGVRGTTLDQLTKTLNNTPDRAQLANDAYQLMLERSAPTETAQDRALAQRTAAMGRRGSGMYNSEQMDLATARERERDMARRDLANNAAGLSLQDQMDKLNAARGVTSDFSGYDTAAGNLNLGYQNSNNAERNNAFGRELALGDTAFNRNRALSSDTLNLAQIGRNDALTERNAMTDAERYGNDLTAQKANASRTYGLDQYGIGRDSYGDSVSERDKSQAYDQQGFNNRNQQFNTLASYEDMLRQNGRADRNEVRGERGYQQGLDQQAIDNNVRQRQIEDQMRGSDIGYGSTLAGLGYSSDPYGALANAGQQYGAQASDAYGATGDLLSSWAKNRALGSTNAMTAPRPVYAG